MSCTVFYKGTLKDNTDLDEVFSAVTSVLGKANVTIDRSETMICVRFLRGKTEPLIFQFTDRAINGFCKWNGNNAEEFLSILELFYQLKPFFKRLTVDDDGAWQEYVAQKTLCKIALRSLTEDEKSVVERARSLESEPMTAIEQLIYKNAQFIFNPNEALLRLIIRDFALRLNLKEPDDFQPERIIQIADEVNFWGNHFHLKQMAKMKKTDGFERYFNWMLLEIWLSTAFVYKGKGIVKELPHDVRGLQSSKEAAFDGIRSLFLNRHTGGASNAKEAEMRKLAKKYYRTGALGEILIMDQPERVFEFLFSMLDYLGLKYIGVSDERQNHL